jgi:hypothetical protein
MNPERRSFLQSSLAWLSSLPLFAWMARPVEAKVPPPNHPSMLGSGLDWRGSVRFWCMSAVELGKTITRIAKVVKFDVDCSDGLNCGPASAMAEMIEQGAFIRWIPVTDMPTVEDNDNPGFRRSLLIAYSWRGKRKVGMIEFNSFGDEAIRILGITHWAEAPSAPTTTDLSDIRIDGSREEYRAYDLTKDA